MRHERKGGERKLSSFFVCNVHGEKGPAIEWKKTKEAGTTRLFFMKWHQDEITS